jgi:hypothetical protein
MRNKYQVLHFRARLVIAMAFILLCIGSFLFAWFALTDLTAFDLMRTSACCVASSDGVIYVRTINLEASSLTFQSNDDGYTWKAAHDVPESVQNELDVPLRQGKLFSMACHPYRTQTCYRISLSGLEESSDGRQSWHSASTPFDIQRYSEKDRGAPIRSLAFVQSESANNSYNLAVANGTEGILIRLSDGTWRRCSIAKLLGKGE